MRSLKKVDVDYQSETEKSSYERIGLEEGLWKLVNTFYDNMGSLPEARTVISTGRRNTLIL